VSETPKKLSLDAALREWPEQEKAASEWEEMAHRIDERVGSGESGASVAFVSDENLFADPLGQIEEGGHNHASPPTRGIAGETRVSKDVTMTMPADRERDRRSLQDLAKMGSMGGLTPPPASVRAPNSSAPSGVHRAGEAKGDDSGLIDFAAVSQPAPQVAPVAQAQVASTPLANAGLFDDEPASVRPGPVSAQLQQPAPSIPPFGPASMPPASLQAPISQAPASFVPASTAAASSSQQALGAMPAEKKKGNGKVIALVLGGLVAVSSMAAGGFFFMKHRAANEAARVAATTATTVAPVVAAAPPPVVAAAEPTPAPEAAVDPNALPVVAAAKPVAKGGAPAPVAVAAAAKPVKEESAKLSAKDIPTTPAGPAGDLGAAMGKAVGADGKPVDATPAAGSTGPQFAAGTVPQKPSQGAVTGAIGAVLPGARACLGPDDPVSRATITFTSAGTVQNVNVSGGAAGKPAEGCIKAALGKAKVAPFAEATYTAPITIRH
jgi:hypothetical protein